MIGGYADRVPGIQSRAGVFYTVGRRYSAVMAIQVEMSHT